MRLGPDNSHAREGNMSVEGRGKEKHMLVLLGLTEAFLFYGTEIWRTKKMQVVIIIYKMSLANQRSNALKPCWLYNSYRADSSGLIDL